MKYKISKVNGVWIIEIDGKVTSYPVFKTQAQAIARVMKIQASEKAKGVR